MNVLDHLTPLLADRYEIVREIGAGGMARVYLARDLRHGRSVALKVLNPDLGALLGVERFLSEIKVTANLHHPNLLPLFDSGEAGGLLFYVMPCVESGSLRRRLDREKHLPVDEAVRIVVGVANALDYAHRQGVIHRDLKPENILMHEGQPLVADFGISLAVSNAGGERFTQTGHSLGTPQYCSPEQAMGDLVVDGRTDVYSLGVVLYEMLGGDPPHKASTLQAIIARVITERPPDIRTIRQACPEHLALAIDCALEKLAADRFSTAGEFAEAVQGRAGAGSRMRTGASGQIVVQKRQRRRTRLMTAGAALAAVLTTAAAVRWVDTRHPPIDIAVRFTLGIDEDESVAVGAIGAPIAISRDGDRIAYLATRLDGVQQLHIRPINDSRAREIPGTVKATQPAFSPDGQSIVFMAGGTLSRLSVAGSKAPTPLATLKDTVYGVTWGNGQIVLGRNRGGLLSVSPTGGTPQPLTVPDIAKGERSHRWPVVLADGKTVLFTVWRDRSATARIAMMSLDDNKVRTLDVAGPSALGLAQGHLIYADTLGRIMAVPFDRRSGRVTGTSVAGEQTTVSLPGAVKAALSGSGTLIYSSPQAAALELVFVDTAGRVSTMQDQKRERYGDPRFSPDGNRIAFVIGSDTTTDIYLLDLATRARERLTAQSGNKSRPEWTADGQRVLFQVVNSGGSELWSRLADKSRPADRVVKSDREAAQGVPVRDGHSVVYRTDSESRFGMNMWWLDSTSTSTPVLIASGRAPSISPDNHWVAYVSDRSGTLEVYLNPLPPGGATSASCQVSDGGGSEPAWSADGKHLYYRDGLKFMTATLHPGAGCPGVTRRRVFEGPMFTSEYHRQYDVSPSGSGFVMLREYGHQSGVEVVHNWLADLRSRMAPTADGGAR